MLSISQLQKVDNLPESQDDQLDRQSSGLKFFALGQETFDHVMEEQPTTRDSELDLSSATG